MLTLGSLVLAALTLPVGTSAGAQDLSQSQRDAQCAVAMVRVMAVTAPADQAAVKGVMLFFAGKLLGRHTGPEARDLITAAESDVTDANIQAIGLRCAQEMMTLGEVLGS